MPGLRTCGRHCVEVEEDTIVLVNLNGIHVLDPQHFMLVSHQESHDGHHPARLLKQRQHAAQTPYDEPLALRMVISSVFLNGGIT